VYQSANVTVVNSAGVTNLPGVKRITAVKYFATYPASSANIASSAAILAGAGGSTGNQIWFENQTSGAVVDLLTIYDTDGVTVSLGGTAVLFIYGTISRGV
jgi:hypothetical protein